MKTNTQIHANMKTFSPVKELRRFIPGKGWVQAATPQAPQDATGCPTRAADGQGGGIGHPGEDGAEMGVVTDNGETMTGGMLSTAK